MKTIICPTCHCEMYINLDEWGHTPWHLHCDNCHINIGLTQINHVEKYIKEKIPPNTYIEEFNFGEKNK